MWLLGSPPAYLLLPAHLLTLATGLVGGGVTEAYGRLHVLLHREVLVLDRGDGLERRSLQDGVTEGHHSAGLGTEELAFSPWLSCK